MKFRSVLLCFLCFLWPSLRAFAAVPLLDPRITGTNSQVASGTFTVKSGATFTVESGATFTFGAPLSLANGGTGVALVDPNADRILFWDDSAGAMAFLTVGSGLTLTGTTLTTDATTIAPVNAPYITKTADATLTAEFALGTLATGLLQVTTTTGDLTSVTTSAGLAALISDESGSGALLFGTSPTITTPTFSGAATWPAGVRQTFAPDATTPGLNVGSIGGDPSTPSNGDLWYDSTANELTARINGANVALGAGGGGGGGTLTLARFTPLDNQPPASTYATLDTRNAIAVLDFDASTAESAVFVGIIPEAADFTTGIAVRIIWMATSATSGDVIWTTAFERGNTDLDTDSFATGIDSAAATTNATSGIPTTTTINHSGSEIDGLTAGDLFRVKLTRKAADASDTMTGDAEVIAIELRQR